VNGLEITHAEVGGATVLRLAGDFDIAGESEVRVALDRAQSTRPEILVIDLAKVDFMDSTGLRVILGADARARRDGNRLVLVRGPEHVHRVFLVALLDRRLEIVDDLREVTAPKEDSR
jgi:anti-anti-sigma factor